MISRCLSPTRTCRVRLAFFSFFFNDTATTEIYTLSLHDALPIYLGGLLAFAIFSPVILWNADHQWVSFIDRKSTRLNSSHSQISYAVFCLKKKNKTIDGH